VRIAVLNAGGWGTALAVKLANQGEDVYLWARRPEQAARLMAESENRAYLPGVSLPPNVQITSQLDMATANAEVVVIAAIASYLSDLCRSLKPVLPSDALVVHGTKGLDPRTGRRPSEVIIEALGNEGSSRVGVLAGPNHAEEIARGLPAAAVLACTDVESGARLQELLNTPSFRVYTNSDVTGVELCSAAKNVIAIAAGIGDGLGYGDNGKAALITRGLAELWRLVERHGGSLSTVAGLAGIGDVVATCTSKHSRNRWAGEQLGHGRTMSEVLARTSMVVEGITAAKGVVDLARRVDVEMPICEAVSRILFENQSPQQALIDLLAREVATE
jgi:glycerol-3-phosphate dehydrogenase (NAD(P)+)